jgi:hypothetical protein
MILEISICRRAIAFNSFRKNVSLMIHSRGAIEIETAGIYGPDIGYNPSEEREITGPCSVYHHHVALCLSLRRRELSERDT